MHCFARMVKGPLRLRTNFKVKCFRLRCKLNGIGKYVLPCPRFASVDLDIVCETQLEESASWPILHNVHAFDATMDSTANGGVLIGLGTRKRQQCSLCLVLAIVAAEEIGAFNGRKGALQKRIRTSMSNADGRKCGVPSLCEQRESSIALAT